MEYLVEMRQGTFITSPSDGIAFIEIYVKPTLELAQKLKTEGKIIAGGAIAGEIGFSFIIEAETAQDIDNIIESLPIWPRMKTKVTPLISFEGREQTIKNRLEAIKKRMAERKENKAA
ncbi:MAG: muconolactone Delta-isomerase family protein [Ferruginibacter sp.]